MFTRSKRFRSFASRLSFLLLLVMVGGVFPAIPNITEAAPMELGTTVVDAGKADAYTCSFSGSALDAAMGVLACVGYYVLKFTAFIAVVSGLLLNLSVEKLIVGMADLIQPGGVSAVEDTWKIIRDLTNVFLVFLTVFIGIATIVGVSGYGYKQLLWKVILAALLVNFSITFTYFIIDVGNFFAVSIYSSLLQASGLSAVEAAACIGSIASPDSAPRCRSHSIGAAYADLFSMSTLFNPNLIPSESQREKRWEHFVTFMSGAVFMLILAFAFLAGAFLFIGRFVILVFLIIVSPLGLVAWITGVSGVGRRWWHMLINQTLVAPLLLLFWLISYLVIRGFLNQQLGQDRLDNLSTAINNASEFNTILVFVIGSGFLIGSIILAKSLGAAGASRALGAGKAATGLAFAYSAGLMSQSASNRYQRRVAKAHDETDPNYNSVRNRAYRKVSGTFVDRGIQNTLSAPANTGVLGSKSYAARRDSAKTAQTQRLTQLNAQGKQQGIERAVNTIRRSKDEKEVAAAKAVVARASGDDINAVVKGDTSKLVKNPELLGAMSKQQLVARASRPDTTPEQKKALMQAAYGKEIQAIAGSKDIPENEQQKIIGGLSGQDAANLQSHLEKNPEQAKYLTPAVYAQIIENKDEKWNTSAISDMGTKGRFAAFFPGEDGTSPTRDAMRDTSKKLTNKDLENLPSEIYEKPEFWQSLAPKQFDHLTKTKSEMFTEAQRNNAKDWRNEYLENDADLSSELNVMGPREKADLSPATLKRAAREGLLDTRTMSEMMKNNLTPEKVAAIRGAVEERGKQIKTSGSPLVDTSGKPIDEPKNLSNEEQTVVALHNWFNNPNRPSVS